MFSQAVNMYRDAYSENKHEPKAATECFHRPGVGRKGELWDDDANSDCEVSKELSTIRDDPAERALYRELFAVKGTAVNQCHSRETPGTYSIRPTIRNGQDMARGSCPACSVPMTDGTNLEGKSVDCPTCQTRKDALPGSDGARYPPFLPDHRRKCA